MLTTCMLGALGAGMRWWVTWPERTAGRHVELWIDGEHAEAKKMVTASLDDADYLPPILGSTPALAMLENFNAAAATTQDLVVTVWSHEVRLLSCGDYRSHPRPSYDLGRWQWTHRGAPRLYPCFTKYGFPHLGHGQ